MSTIAPPITPEDLLTMPDGDAYELVDGELKELHRGLESSWVAGQILYIVGHNCPAISSEVAMTSTKCLSEMGKTDTNSLVF